MEYICPRHTPLCSGPTEMAWISGNTSFGLWLTWHYPCDLNEGTQSDMDKLGSTVSPCPGY